jgi:hypothetical protein
MCLTQVASTPCGGFGAYAQGIVSWPARPESSVYPPTRSSPSTQRFAALGEASEADRCGPIALGPAVAVVDRLAVCPGDRETGDGDCLAP